MPNPEISLNTENQHRIFCRSTKPMSIVLTGKLQADSTLVYVWSTSTVRSTLVMSVGFDIPPPRRPATNTWGLGTLLELSCLV